jgi:hypothetical protein
MNRMESGLLIVSVLRAYAGDLKPDRLNVAVNISNAASLFRTTGREIRRVEILDQRSGLQHVGQRRFVAIMIIQNEIRGSRASI